MVKDAVASYPPVSFLGVRFVIATVAFVAIFPRSVLRLDRRTVVGGVAAGLFMTLGYVFQTLGLVGHAASASRAGFITGMFVVITPMLQVLVLRKPPRLTTVIGVAVATAGLWLLSMSGPLGWTVNDTFVLLCAVAYAAQFIVIAALGRDWDVGALTFVQLATTAVACVAVGAAWEHPGLPVGSGVWGALVFTGVLASAVAFWVQTSALREISPTRVALILIMEPAFAGVFGFLLAGERLGARGWLGAALILAGMVVAEVLGSVRPAEEAGETFEAVPESGAVL
jgi:drug/metabolite transporter (DMT)-like permease